MHFLILARCKNGMISGLHASIPPCHARTRRNLSPAMCKKPELFVPRTSGIALHIFARRKCRHAGDPQVLVQLCTSLNCLRYAPFAALIVVLFQLPSKARLFVCNHILFKSSLAICTVLKVPPSQMWVSLLQEGPVSRRRKGPIIFETTHRA